MQTTFNPTSVVLWTQNNCPACDSVKRILDELKISYEAKIIKDELSKEEFYKQFPTARTIPQIIVDGKWIGGFRELMGLIRSDITKTTNMV